MLLFTKQLQRVGQKRLAPSILRATERFRPYIPGSAREASLTQNNGEPPGELPVAQEPRKGPEIQLEAIANEIQALRKYIEGPGQSMAHLKYQLSAIRKDIAAVRPSLWQQKPYRLFPPSNDKTVPQTRPRWDDATHSIQVVSPVTNDYISVPNIWLRDHCQCSSCIHPDTRQRNIETYDIPQDIRIHLCKEDESGFRVTWDDGHESFFEHGFLTNSALRHKSRRRQGIPSKVIRWSSNIQYEQPEVPYDEVMASDDGVRKWLRRIRQYGFCYVDGCPPTPEATEKLLEKIAFIRNTHYGGFYDFTSDLASKDTAYTSISLPTHTDNTYFSDPSGLQMFHLLSHTEGEGGTSLLVDGFYAAAKLLKEHPEAYEILSKVNIYSHASGNEGISIQPYRSFPVLLHDPEDHHLVQVRWNTADRAAIDMPLEDVQKWYHAARIWESILRDPETEYWEQLRPGRPLIFDNWRVLHGRSAFTGKRRMAGGYVNRDDFISRYKTLQYGNEEVLRSIGTA